MHCFYKLFIYRNQPTLAGQQRHCWRQIDKRKHTRKRFGAHLCVCVCVSIIIHLMLWSHIDVNVEMLKASRRRWNVESHSDGKQVLERNHPLQRWAPCIPSISFARSVTIYEMHWAVQRRKGKPLPACSKLTMTYYDILWQCNIWLYLAISNK